MAQAKHVLGVVPAARVTNPRLAGGHYLEALLSKGAQHMNGRDVGVFFGAAFVRPLGEQGGNRVAKLILGHREEIGGADRAGQKRHFESPSALGLAVPERSRLKGLWGFVPVPSAGHSAAMA